MGGAVQKTGFVDPVKEWNELIDNAVKEWKGQDDVAVALYLYSAKKPE